MIIMGTDTGILNFWADRGIYGQGGFSGQSHREEIPDVGVAELRGL
jgi:hypothetical protein